MSRRMIEIKPGTESWNAWLAFHRGSKAELVMLSCQRQGRAFMAWSEWPPERAREGQVTVRRNEVMVLPLPAPTIDFRDHAIDGLLDAWVERVATRAAVEGEEVKALTRAGRKARKTAAAREAALESVQVGKAPSLEGLADIGTVETFDPFEIAEVAAGKRAPEKLKVRTKVVNLRDDPIGQMAKRGQIEVRQLDAARKWQALHDTAMIGGARGIDPGNMKVDGGRFSEPVTDTQRECMKRLAQIDLRLGEVGTMLVRRVLGDRMTIAQLAAALGSTDQVSLRRLGWRVRECLDTLAGAMGLVAEGRRARAPDDDAATMARYANDPALHRAVHRALRPKVRKVG